MLVIKGCENLSMAARELSVSFGYQFPATSPKDSTFELSEFDANGDEPQNSKLNTGNGSFSCLSGAALSANATLANTRICNGLIGDEILPNLDSPTSFRRIPSSPSLTRLDLLSAPPLNVKAPSDQIASTGGLLTDSETSLWKPTNVLTREESSSFLNAMDVQMAGGAAGEDRVQAVCSEENGWLFCGIYDGFNGRDAADFLAGTLYEKIDFFLRKLDENKVKMSHLVKRIDSDIILSHDCGSGKTNSSHSNDEESIYKYFRSGVIDCLNHALDQAERDFMYMVEQEMELRPELVSVGSCVLVLLLYGNDFYILNLGDSRAVLATNDPEKYGLVNAIQLTEGHTVDNHMECCKLLTDHPDEPSPIVNGRVKGKLRLTRAFGVGYLKKTEMNDMLMGILQVQNLCNPPYVYTHPFTMIHRASERDQFVVLGSDGLFDFLSNDEVVQLVHTFIHQNPFGDPAKHLVEQLIERAADNAGFSTEELMRIPAGRRRKYHDDVTVIVIVLGNKKRASTASTASTSL